MIPDRIRPALDGAHGAVMSTCSLDGTPNCTFISQVFYVDPAHVALSFQFFNKTIRNVRENPFATVLVMHPEAGGFHILRLRYDHSETEGPVFDTMDMVLEAMASMMGVSGLFKLRAADVYEVLSVEESPLARQAG